MFLLEQPSTMDNAPPTIDNVLPSKPALASAGIASSADYSREKHAPPGVLAKLPRPIYYGFVLQRRYDQQMWGLTLALWDNVLVVGHLHEQLVQSLTSQTRASHFLPRYSTGNSLNPLTFLHAFDNDHHDSICHQIKPGDVSINERPSFMFTTLESVTNFVKRCQTLWLLVFRAQESPCNPSPEQSFSTVQQVRMSLQKNNVWPIIFDFYYGQNNSQWQHNNPGSSLVPHISKPNVSVPPHISKPKVALSKKTNKSVTKQYRNPLFNIPFFDVFCDAEDGLRSKEYIRELNVETFSSWLSMRKHQWRPKWRKPITPIAMVQPMLVPQAWRNQLFKDTKGQVLCYYDNWDTPTEGTNVNDYLTDIHARNFLTWLNMRKEMWSQQYQPHALDDGEGWSSSGWSSSGRIEDNSSITVSNDFWSPQRYNSFEEWQMESKAKWKLQYSWNIRKRKRIKEEAEEIVSFPSQSDDIGLFGKWLSVRKNQWRIQRRKRQRRFDLEISAAQAATTTAASPGEGSESPRCVISISSDMVHIDALLEEELAQKLLAHRGRIPFDLSFLFDGRLGACDDVIAHCMQFLHPSEHGTLLCISKTTSECIKERSDMWQQLCPNKWRLPRKPRKPWHEMYISNIRKEEEESRKRSDEILNKVAFILFKGDHVQKIEKLIEGAQISFGFDINYNSGVIGERNSILNLAVIHRRFKVVKWLLESKLAGLDLETNDRGGFTPLMNAAWAGDKVLVRLLLGKGCNRKTIGTGHYTQPLALPDFKGFTPEGWARQRGHDDIANLIHLGL